MNAIGEVLPNVEVNGCFYHLPANIWKHIQSACLQQRCINDQPFALHLRMFAVLAFVPVRSVIEYCDLLCDNIYQIYVGECDEILEYFEDTFIGRFRRNAPRRSPLFTLDIWNMFHRTHNELPRTNNSIDGLHRRFQANVSSCHPVFY